MADLSQQHTNTTPLDHARDPEIHVMPEKFLGVAARASLPPVSRPAPQPAAALPPGVTAAAEQHGPAKGLLLAAGLVVLLLLVIAVAMWYPRSKVVPRQSAAQPPANRNTTLAPPAPAMATSTPATAASSTPALPAVPLRNAPDRDADGLTDVEEREIYGTDSANADTDADEYLDGGEVFYLYNPAAIAPVTLKDSGIVRIVDEPSLGVRTLIPLSWTRRTVPQGVLFTGASGEYIEITAEQNSLGLSLSAWYRHAFPENSQTAPLSFSNRLGTIGLKSLDGLQAFFAHGNRVFVVTYGTAGSRELSYRRTFEMLLNSFTTTATVPAPEAILSATNASSSAFTASSTLPAETGAVSSTRGAVTASSTPSESGTAATTTGAVASSTPQ